MNYNTNIAEHDSRDYFRQRNITTTKELFMSIKLKMFLGILFLLIIFIFIISLAIFLNNQTHSLLTNKVRAMEMLDEWDIIKFLTTKILYTRELGETIWNWKLNVSSYDMKIKLFVKREIDKIEKQGNEADKHEFNTLLKLWNQEHAFFEKLKIQLEHKEIINYIDRRIPLLKKNTENIILKKSSPELQQIVEDINNFELSSNPFNHALRHTFSVLDQSIENQIKSLKQNIQLASLIIIMFSMVCAVIFAHTISRRIKLVAKTFSNVSRGDFSTKLNIKTKDEFHKLSESFNSFVNELKKNVKLVVDFMEHFGNTITEDINMMNILDLMTQSAIDYSTADGAAIFMTDTYGKSLSLKSIAGNFPPPLDVPFSDLNSITEEKLKSFLKKTKIPIGKTFLGQVALSEECIFLKDIKNDKRLRQNIENNRLFINSIIVIPIKISTKIVGILSVVKTDRQQKLTDLDFIHLETFCKYTAIIIDNFLKYQELTMKKSEMDIAKKIQTSLLPELPEHENYEMTAEMIPAEEVGGDYYDFYTDSTGRHWYGIGDVTGHGLTSGLIMLMAQSSVLTALHARPDIEIHELYNTINNLLFENTRNRMFVDQFMTISFLNSDNHGNFNYCGSHLLQIIYRKKTKKCERIEFGGLWVGLKKNVNETIQTKKFSLNKGDILCLFTDGVIEAMNNKGEQFDLERLENIIIENCNKPVEKIKEKILSSIFDFMYKQDDDITLFVVKKI